MTSLTAIIPGEPLPALVQRAADALLSAKSSAEVLEARDMARVAYDAAKSAARIAKAKQAHDSLVAEVHRAQANALGIRARAEMRLAEEYDAAKPDEGAFYGNQWSVSDGNGPITAADAGLTRKDIHDARRLRDAERQDPGVISRALNDMLDRGEEPTRAALRREVVERPKPPRQMDDRALWLWGRLKDFERDGIMAAGARRLVSELTQPMREDVRRLAPLVRAFLQQVEDEA